MSMFPPTPGARRAQYLTRRGGQLARTSSRFRSVVPCYTATVLAAEHSAYGLHLNNVIAKRLGISAGSD
jgi:hypothetical protein